MFPERLRALRKGQNLTLNELAQALNEHLGPGERPNTPTQIGNWERGIRNPSFVEVRKVAEFFDVSMDYLCGRTERDGHDLAKLFFSNQDLLFEGTVLTSQDRYEIFQLINGYLKERSQRSETDTFYGKQEELNLDFKE